MLGHTKGLGIRAVPRGPWPLSHVQRSLKCIMATVDGKEHTTSQISFSLILIFSYYC